MMGLVAVSGSVIIIGMLIGVIIDGIIGTVHTRISVIISTTA